LRPLLTALEQANARESGFEKWKEGFDYRLIEAMTTVATLCADERLHRIRQQKKGRKLRPKGESPFTIFFKAQLRRNSDCTAEDIRRALINDTSGKFELSGDKLSILTTEKKPRQLKISGIPTKLSKTRRLTRTSARPPNRGTSIGSHALPLRRRLNVRALR
jgi:hypothetical protein